MKRVVITGMAGVTSLGNDWAGISANFLATAAASAAWTSGTASPS